MEAERTRSEGVVWSTMLHCSLFLALVVGCSATSTGPRSLAKSDASLPIQKSGSKDTANDAKGGDDRSESKGVGFVAAALEATALEAARGSCRSGMVAIEGRYCIDRYEA